MATQTKVTVPISFMGDQRDYEADAIVTTYEHDDHHVEWTAMRDAYGRPLPLDPRGRVGYDLSGCNDRAIAEAVNG